MSEYRWHAYALLLILLVGWGFSRSRAEFGTEMDVEDLEGFTVLDRAGSPIGTVERVIVRLEQGAIDYVVVAPAAAAGTGYLVLPWRVLELNRAHRTLVYQRDLALLAAAPHLADLEGSEQPRWDEPVLRYWGAP